MGDFIQDNIIWLVPIISIILTIIIKISAKPESLTLKLTDYLDFGFDLSISSLIVLLTNIKTNDNVGIWLLLLFFVLVMVTSIIINRLGWNKETKELKIIGVIIPDIIGIFLLIIATLYSGGIFK